MKKAIFTMAAVIMMSSAAMAQDEQKKDNKRQMPDKTEMTQRRTDMMVQRYGLDDKQKAKLLKLNTEYADKIGGPGMGMRRGGDGMRPGMGGGMRPGQRPNMGGGDNNRGGQRPEMTEEQRTEMRKQMEEMRKNREAYGAELKKIMTEEQYKKYQEDEQSRFRGGRGGMRGGQRGPRDGGQAHQ